MATLDRGGRRAVFIASVTLPQQLTALVAYRQFITYRLQPSDKPGKFDKIPCHHATGVPCDAHDPAVHTDYPTALAAVQRADTGHGAGVGFTFTDSDPFWFLDVDNAYDGTAWSPLALALINDWLPGAAWEISSSGLGLHAFGTGVLPPHSTRNKAYGLELYHHRRFVALTGNTFGNGSAGHTPPHLAALCEAFFPPLVQAARGEWTDGPCLGWQGPPDDDELIDLALKSKSAASRFGHSSTKWRPTFADLWTGAIPDGVQSEADAALAAHLAFWTGRDCERIERLMRRSALWRDKWDRPSPYLEPTILNACAIVTKVATGYEPPKPPVTFTVPIAPARDPTGATGSIRSDLDSHNDSTASAPTGRSYVLTQSQANDKQEWRAIEVYLRSMGVNAAYNEFSTRTLVTLPEAPSTWVQLTDKWRVELWLQLRAHMSINYPEELTNKVLDAMAWRGRYHPVRDYLNQVQVTWDGTSRVDDWLCSYLGVEPSDYARAVGRLWLVAAVRRIRQPGAKFDEMLVLEGPQGTGKSTTIAQLCPHPSYFTDALHLSMPTKELLEITAGKWIVEAPELSKLSSSEVEQVKAMLSRQVDSARMSYDRDITDRPREWVAFGTTNADQYLRDRTGNRRFWPVRCGQLDILSIARDRDQLWAEAAMIEASGVGIRLDPGLYDAAREEQESRLVSDPFVDQLAPVLRDLSGRITSTAVFEFLHIIAERRPAFSHAIGAAMKDLGWINTRIRINGERTRWFVKGDPAREIISIGGSLRYSETMLSVVDNTANKP